MRVMRKVTTWGVGLTLVLIATASMLAQSTYTGRGNVTDAKGKGIAGVEITLADSRTPNTIVKHTTTDASGNYSFTDLPRANAYTVKAVQAKGGPAYFPSSGSISYVHQVVNFKVK